MRIYVASSWRNSRQQEIVKLLQDAGHDVYDFKHPEPGNEGFHWSEIDPSWKGWKASAFREALNHPIADAGFGRDMAALRDCDVCVLVMPCGRSAHLELGYAIGAGKRSIILLDEQNEPELMYKMADLITDSVEEMLKCVGSGIQQLSDAECGAFIAKAMGWSEITPCPSGGDPEKCSEQCTGFIGELPDQSDVKHIPGFVSDPAMTQRLMHDEAFVDVMLIEGVYVCNFCGSKTHSEDCMDFYKAENARLERAVAEAWMLAKGFKRQQAVPVTFE